MKNEEKKTCSGCFLAVEPGLPRPPPPPPPRIKFLDLRMITDESNYIYSVSPSQTSPIRGSERSDLGPHGLSYRLQMRKADDFSLTLVCGVQR